MKLVVAAVGIRMPEWVTSAWQDYARRLPGDFSPQLKEIRPEPRTGGKTPKQMMAAEAQRLCVASPAGALTIALDENGRDISTYALRDQLQNWHDDQRDVTLFIGGPDGLDAELKARATQRWRLSSMTLPHPLVRVVLIEQIYRAWSMMVGHPYHRE